MNLSGNFLSFVCFWIVIHFHIGLMFPLLFSVYLSLYVALYQYIHLDVYTVQHQHVGVGLGVL